MVTADEILAMLREAFDAHPGRRRRARQRAGRGVAGRRRPRPGRRHRLGHPAVLRRLRPGPADRRRSAAQLPVRPRGVRPARGDAGRRLRRRPRRADEGRRCWRSCPGTASTTPASCSRPGRCPPSAADRPDARRVSSARRRGHSPYGTVCRRKPRVSRKPVRFSRCVSHAVQVLRRSGACSLGLFHASTQVAVARQPLAEQTGEVVSVRHRRRPRPDEARGDAGQPRGEPPGIALAAPAPRAALKPARGATLRTEYCTDRCHVRAEPFGPPRARWSVARSTSDIVLDPLPAAVGEHHGRGRAGRWPGRSGPTGASRGPARRARSRPCGCPSRSGTGGCGSRRRREHRAGHR